MYSNVKLVLNGVRVGIRNEWAAHDDRPTVHVRCSLLWSVFTTFYDFSCDTNLGLAADAIAKEKWTLGFLSNLQMQRQDHYSQFGMIHGVVQVDDQEERSLLMRGVKEHLIGQPYMHDIHTGITNYIVQENGTAVYCNASCTPGYLTSTNTGFMIKAVGDIMPASSVDLPLAILLGNANDIPKKFTFSMQPQTGKRLDVKVHIEDTVTFYTGPDWRVQICEGFGQFMVNGVPGWGVCQTLKRFDGSRPIPAEAPLPKLYSEPAIGTSEALVLPLSAPVCQVSSLAGGKGSQLAKLVALRDLASSVEYKVPCGFCITTMAFRQHLQENKELLAFLKELREVSCTIHEGDLTDTCKQTVELFSKTPISNHLKDTISRIFMELFEDSQGLKTFAVRSSAVGEDTSLTSAAGQMQTFLGLKTLEKIFEATQECWASNFAFQAVQYRRQYGQVVDSAMAVVVQEIVPAECAGVAFSRDPMTGNPAKIVINSNYGLGESVVSGVVEADTITLHVEGDGKLTMEDTKIGHKEETVSVAEGGGIQTIHQTDDKVASCSISDEMCLRIGRVAVMLDKCFSDARDIEWAVVGETLYLLQARAITTFNAPSRYELLHEFDTGLALDKIWMTTANIQEMCPGAVSPLTICNFFWDCDIIDQVMGLLFQRPLTVPAARSILVAYNHAFISLTNLVWTFEKMVRIEKKEFGSMLFGESFSEECLAEGRKLNEPLPLWHIYLNRLVFVLIVLFNRKTLEREFAKAVNHLTKRWNTAQEQYDDICRYPSDRSKMLEYHGKESHKSAIWQEVIGSMIKKYTDVKHLPTHISLLLSSCPNVESANVPVAMEEVCRAILKEGKSDSFQAMTQEDALCWLQTPSSGEAGRAFSVFLQRHGHRCVKEVALREKSWDMEPVNVIPSLQAILASGSHTSSEKKRNISSAEALDQLGIALPALERKLLVNYIVPKAREGVAARESAKSMFVKINHRLKQAYWRLAELMVQEGRLPDVDLLFFLTHDEIGRLLKDRSPALIARAMRRRRVLPEQHACKFDLIAVGRPQMIHMNEDFKSEFKLQGTPISQGVVKSTARVVTDLKDATKIKKGDILITIITDIGWSPYFPLISGLVTEIGGVLSHGAVVAREYGIPCVVNVKRVTSIIQSGDSVIMDGSKGIVEKVEVQPLDEAPSASTP